MKILFWTFGALVLLCYCVYPVLLFVVYCLAQTKAGRQLSDATYKPASPDSSGQGHAGSHGRSCCLQ